MDPLFRVFGTFIRKRRKALGLTQEELGEKLRVTSQAVTGWEKFNRGPTSTNLSACIRVFFPDHTEDGAVRVALAEMVEIATALRDEDARAKQLGVEAVPGPGRFEVRATASDAVSAGASKRRKRAASSAKGPRSPSLSRPSAEKT